MQHGFIQVAAMTPHIHVADPAYNAKKICALIDEATDKGAKIIVFPELCITGYTCHDLFLQDQLLADAKKALAQIIAHTDGVDALVFVGLPLEKDNKLYNVAAVLNFGELLGFVPKTHIPTYGEYYEGRHFAVGNGTPVPYLWGEEEIPFGTDILFYTDALDGLGVACEICEDLWVANPPSTAHAIAGANLIVNLSASNDIVGKSEYRRMLISATSARLLAGYVYASAGEGESTQDVVYGGHNLIAENGVILSESKRFTPAALHPDEDNDATSAQCDADDVEGAAAQCDADPAAPSSPHGIYAQLDIHRLRMERRRMNSFAAPTVSEYMLIPFAIVHEETPLTRSFSPTPFVPADPAKRQARCEEILSIQAAGLKKRLAHTHAKTAVVGISGGLDSTLALLVTVRAFDLLGLDKKGIKTVTMPCFGTTDRTYDNACGLSRLLGTDLLEIDIKEAVRQHFKDIGQSEDVHDVTYENGQARERTQILMDIANKEGGLVIGTGDMSELALGWATYNGDHMSMYGVNVGVPKTLVRHLVRYQADVYAASAASTDAAMPDAASYADETPTASLAAVLYDILDTPVSPELLPPTDGQISQKTEDLVGPYELHDFFLYYMLRMGFAPKKVFRLAVEAFASTAAAAHRADTTDTPASASATTPASTYDIHTIYHWLTVFYRRFFSQQFKRSCLPDGPKVGSVALSPRGDLRMPSDASVEAYLREIEDLGEELAYM